VVAPAHAVDVKAGNWDLSFSGNVNAFATYQVCGVSAATGGSNDDSITGVPIACTRAKDEPNRFAIESGLLPSAFVFTAKTRAYDLDVSATVSFWPGLHVADTRTGNAQNADFSADMRQNFLTFGDASWGTVKLGKDLGVFGGDAILSDMTLLGVGAGASGILNHNVTIGHIGTGYIYADWIPQITYISPNFGGAQLTIAAIESFRLSATQGGVTANGVNWLPGVQAKVTYDLAGGMGRIWAGGMWQNVKSDIAVPTATDPENHPTLNSYAGELGAKVNISGLQPMVYGYIGKGIGTTLIGLDAVAGLNSNAEVEGRTSYGWFAQVTYQIPNTKFRPGISWGMSYLNQNTDVVGGDDANLLHWNGMGTIALFYQATDTLTLVAEYDHLRTRGWNGGDDKSNSGALGAIMFF
jgi:predicted porin